MKKHKKIEWWIYFIPILIILTVLIYILSHSRIKLLSMTLFYLGPIIISGLSLILLIIGLIISFKKRPFFTRWRLIGFASLALLFFNDIFYSSFPSYYDDKPSRIEFIVPSNYEQTVAWGGYTVKENYHKMAPDQCWAYDLVISKNGKTFTNKGEKLTDYYCYGDKLISPSNGEVIKAYDSDPEMPIGALGGGSSPFGNHIIMKVASSEFLYLCHLQPNSILVKKGDIVTQGQELGLIGNSGNTSEPHLHMHLQSDSDYGEGIPMYFSNIYVNDEFVEKVIPKGGVDKDENIIGDKIKNAIN